MTQRDDQVYVGHMLDTANKAIGFVQGLTIAILRTKFEQVLGLKP